MNPRVSVVIPVYNRERYIAAAIDSVLTQTLADFELLVVDDGSTDSTPDIIRAYRDPRINLVSNAFNMGIPRARNLGVQLARGKYVAFLDSDDFAYPARLQRQSEHLDANPGCAMVGSWELPMDEHGAICGSVKRRPISPEQLRAHSIFRCGVSGRAIMAPTDILREYQFRDSYPVSEDFDLCVRLSKDHDICNLPEVLIRHRKHEGNTSREKTQLMTNRVRSILTRQLNDLEVKFNEDDLRFHLLLRRLSKQPFKPDRRFLEWSEQWLLGLRNANQRARLYPEPAFSRALGLYWLYTCWKAFGSRPLGVSQHLLGSVLLASAWGGFQDLVGLYLQSY